MRDLEKNRIWARNYYHTHKIERLEYYMKNRERIILMKRKKRNKNLSAPILPYDSRRNKIPFKIYKNEVISYYGGLCMCCGEKNLSFLTIDHIKDNGKEHGTKKNRYKGESLYRHLAELNYPTGLQVLCFNCNIGKRNNKGICPHNNR